MINSISHFFLIFQTIVKCLCFLLTLASILPTNAANVTFSKIVHDCKDWNQPFIDQETHNSYKTVLIFEANQWNINLYDEKFIYLNTTTIMDVHDLMSGYYLENAVFTCCQTLEGRIGYDFTTEEESIIYKIRQIWRKYKDFCSAVKAAPMPNHPHHMRFPSKVKICTSVCGPEAQKPDFCMELRELN